MVYGCIEKAMEGEGQRSMAKAVNESGERGPQRKWVVIVAKEGGEHKEGVWQRSQPQAL